MFRNYLITALRNLFRDKLYTTINIGGLAVGLAACLLIIVFVRDEFGYDRFVPAAERTYRLDITFMAPPQYLWVDFTRFDGWRIAVEQ